MPKVSIITAAYLDSYDKLTWLGEMIRSVVSQTFQDWELIIIDDASPIDPGKLKIEFYGDSRIRWFKSAQNQGPSLCRNTAAALAESEALLPLDADDMLADEAVLATLYGAWAAGKSQIIYGDLQRVIDGERGKIFSLPEYTFQRAMDLNGVMPVTALHSIDCHRSAGGWKKELSHGLEDVEYWIAAGKAGFCGKKIPALVLLYRKHQDSRHSQLQLGRHETEMRNKIIDIHKDVYEGRYPMGCCGGGTAYIPPQSQNNNGQIQMNLSSTLEQFGAGDKTWVEYTGNRSGSFDMVGDHSGIHYRIQGPGHKLEVHRLDLPKFRRSGRGLDFKIDAAPPVGTQPVLVEIQEAPQRYQGPEPELARIERLDEIAAQSRGVEVERVDQGLISTSAPVPGTGGNYPQGYSQSTQAQTFDLSPLDLGEKVQQMLEAESWTIEKLAGAEPDELLPYPGVGPATAGKIIQAARKYANV